MEKIPVRSTCDSVIFILFVRMDPDTVPWIPLTCVCTKQEEARRTADYCEAVLVRVIDSLQRHYLSVRDLIGAQGEAAAARVHVSMQTLEDEMEEMKKRDEELERLAKTDRDVCFLQVLWSHLCLKDVPMPVPLPHLFPFAEMAVPAASHWRRAPPPFGRGLRGPTPPLPVHKKSCGADREADGGILQQRVFLDFGQWLVSLSTFGNTVSNRGVFFKEYLCLCWL